MDTIEKIRSEIAEYGSIWVEYTIPGHTDRDIEKIVENVLNQAKHQVLAVIDKHRTSKPAKWILLSNDEMKKSDFSWMYAGTSWMNYKCSSCGKLVHNSLLGHEENRTKYCANCGARMEVC